MSVQRALKKSTIDGAFSIAAIVHDLGVSNDEAIDIAMNRHRSHDYVSALWLINECALNVRLLPRAWEEFYRSLIVAAVQKFRPFWLQAVITGRSSLALALPRDQHQCLADVGLFDLEISIEARRFWDSLVALAHFDLSATRIQHGSEAEVLALNHERAALAKVGKSYLVPRQVSIDDSNLGYDIESYEHSASCDTRRFIEVKGYTGYNAVFYLTRGEWNAADRLKNSYSVQVWSLDDEVLIATVPYSELQRHVPCDNGLGKWDIVRVSLSRQALEDAHA